MSASLQSFAMDAVPNVPTQYPNESSWALALIPKGCKIGGVRATIRDANSGVLCKAYVGNQVIPAAQTKNEFIFAKKIV